MTKQEELNFYKITSKTEREIRGAVISITASIEATLVQIMILCELENPKAKPIAFKTLTYSQKINKTARQLKMYNKPLYLTNKQSFSDLHILRLFRNRLAHCGMVWTEDLSYYTIWEPRIGKVDKIDFFEAVKYTIEDTTKNVKNLKRLFIIFGQISLAISADINVRRPGIF